MTEILESKIGLVVALSLKCQYSIGARINPAADAAGKVHSQERKARVRNRIN